MASGTAGTREPQIAPRQLDSEIWYHILILLMNTEEIR